jgi:hypothetical protein
MIYKNPATDSQAYYGKCENHHGTNNDTYITMLIEAIMKTTHPIDH